MTRQQGHWHGILLTQQALGKPQQPDIDGDFPPDGWTVGLSYSIAGPKVDFPLWGVVLAGVAIDEHQCELEYSAIRRLEKPAI